MEKQTDDKPALERRIKDILIDLAPFGLFYRAYKEAEKKPDKVVSIYLINSLVEGGKLVCYTATVMYLLS